MRRGLIIGAALLGAAFLTGLLVWSQTRERVFYQGKPISAWAAQLYAPRAESRAEAVAALKAAGPMAVPELIRLLQAKDSFFRKLAWSIPKLVPQRFRLFVVRNIRMPNASFLRHSAARALATVGPEASPAVPALGRALRDADRELRWEAATALGCIGEHAVPTLVDALSDTNTEVRQAAASALERAGVSARAAAPALIATLGDEQEPVRAASIRALAAMGTAAVPALLHAVESEQGIRRQGAAKALMQILPSRRLATSPLLQMMQDPEPASRRQAIETLAAIHAWDTNTVLAMTGALKDPAAQVRVAAITALGRMGVRAKSAVPELSRIAENGEPSERSAAREALKTVGP